MCQHVPGRYQARRAFGCSFTHPHSSIVVGCSTQGSGQWRPVWAPPVGDLHSLPWKQICCTSGEVLQEIINGKVSISMSHSSFDRHRELVGTSLAVQHSS